MIWDDKAIARLTELVATGISYTLIGREMHITKNAAIGKARRLNLTKSPSPPTPRSAPKPRKPTPPVPVSIPEMRLVTMMQLTDQHCRYPIDTPTEMLFCGRIPDGKPPYCKTHAKLCYMPPRGPNRSGQKPSTQFQRPRPAAPSPHRTSPK